MQVRQSEGAALIVDYGKNECSADTLQVSHILLLLLLMPAQAVKNHKFVPVLEEPGRAAGGGEAGWSTEQEKVDILSRRSM